MSIIVMAGIFVLGAFLGMFTIALCVAARDSDLAEWRYDCTCGWRCGYLASTATAPSFVRCDKCSGIAVRRSIPVESAAS